MKKLLLLAAIFAVVFTGCEQPTNEVNSDVKLPSLTIRNESSYILTDVKFSGISFATSGNDLPVSSQSVKQLTTNDVNKTGYITFTRKDIGIACRTEAISIGDEDYTFTFLDSSVVEESANSSNKKSLAQITFISKVTVELGGLDVPRNDIIDIEWFVNFTKQTEFTLKNTGVGKLLLTGTQPVKITGTGADVFSVVQPTSSEIAPNSSLTFKINFAPSAEQDYNVTVTVNSNDQDGDFTFSIRARGAPPKPIASVYYVDSEIAQNGTINAGEALITLSKNITVTIKNTGVEVLTLDTANITITGADADTFTKTTNPGGSISAGGQTSFVIECSPTKQGENNAVLTIPTNDNSRNPITVYLKVTGVKGSGILSLKQNNTVIGNNSITPFNFGQTVLNSSTSLVFTITNNGNIPLILTGTPAVVSSNAVFAVSTQPANTTIAPTATVQFVIQYTPTLEQEDTGTITITHDGDATPFILNAKGTGYVKRPQISVFYGNTEVPQYGTINAGDVKITQSKNITVIIKNTGEEPLTVDTANITITGEGMGVFTKTTNPAANVAVSGQTQFVISCTPDTEGEYQATLTIPSNDTFRTPYIVYLHATAVPLTYQIGDTGPAGGIIFYDAGSTINGWRYLEASLTDYNAQWGAMGYSPSGGTGLSIGDGKQNTLRIVALLNQRGETGCAAQICAGLTINGFNDWFLPSRDELNLMYQNLCRNNLGNFSTSNSSSFYWSSSEIGINNAYYQSFYNGNQLSQNYRDMVYQVRAIRAF